MLNKEREVIGLYLSSHPLEDYRVIIKHMCKVGVTALDDLEPLNGQEIAVAGVVTSVQHLTTKTGRQFGKFVLEDYEGGTHEFALFGKDYEKFRQYLYQNYFLFIRGKVQPRPFGDNPGLEFKIQAIMQLDEVRDKMIREVHVVVPVEDVTERFVEEFSSKVIGAQGKKHKGEAKDKNFAVLRVAVVDRALGVTLNMYKVELTSELVDYMEDMGLKYTLS